MQPDQAVEVTDDGDAFPGRVPGSNQGEGFHVAVAGPGDFPVQEVEAVDGSHGSLQGRAARERGGFCLVSQRNTHSAGEERHLRISELNNFAFK